MFHYHIRHFLSLVDTMYADKDGDHTNEPIADLARFQMAIKKATGQSLTKTDLIELATFLYARYEASKCLVDKQKADNNYIMHRGDNND